MKTSGHRLECRLLLLPSLALYIDIAITLINLDTFILFVDPGCMMAQVAQNNEGEIGCVPNPLVVDYLYACSLGHHHLGTFDSSASHKPCKHSQKWDARNHLPTGNNIDNATIGLTSFAMIPPSASSTLSASLQQLIRLSGGTSYSRQTLAMDSRQLSNLFRKKDV